MPINQNMIVDVVDDNNHRISATERHLLLQEGLNFRTAHVLLFDNLGRLLLQKLVPVHPRSPNLLGSSAAGYLYAHESYDQAARRKIDEELGLHTPLQDIGRLEMVDGRSRKFVGVFVGKLEAPPRIADEHIAALLYMAADELARSVKDHPDLYTRTFVKVHDHYRRWQERR